MTKSVEKETESITRLAWQCRRGMLELDLLLTNFLENGYTQLSSESKQAFVELLDIVDTELLEYLMGRHVHKEAHIQHVIEAIRQGVTP
ncbi:MAG: succinate dehydrogenase assembly factor 2 [Sulfuriflexus sp.]|nr:succinate dehydrogenase assembly factor 2 [Sulfuriflexus sp.]